MEFHKFRKRDLFSVNLYQPYIADYAFGGLTPFVVYFVILLR